MDAKQLQSVLELLKVVGESPLAKAALEAIVTEMVRLHEELEKKEHPV